LGFFIYCSRTSAGAAAGLRQAAKRMAKPRII